MIRIPTADTIRTNTLLPLVALACILLGATGGQSEMSADDQEPNECRVIINYDEFNLFRYQLRWLEADLGREPNPEEVKAMLEHVVDEHAQAKVDRLVHCIFSLPWGASTAGFKTFQRAPERGWIALVPGMSGFEDSGYDFLEFLLERSHKNGMAFLAGLRMNDRHRGADKEPFYQDHPEWRLKSFRAMDYKYEGVRNAMLAFSALSSVQARTRNAPAICSGQ